MTKKEEKFEYVNREYFDDKITKGVARGVLRHLMHSRYCLVRMNVGFGKTLIAVLSSVGIAMMNGGRVQIGVIAPKAKRLDNSFYNAIKSAEAYFDVKIDILKINNNNTGTFAGLNTMYGKFEKDKEKYQKLTAEYKAIDAKIAFAEDTYKRTKKRMEEANVETEEDDRALLRTLAVKFKVTIDKTVADIPASFKKVVSVEKKTLDELKVRKEKLPQMLERTAESAKKAKETLKTFEKSFNDASTVFILDETHMSLRDSTSTASRNFKKLFKKMEDKGNYVKAIGLTATPTDKSVIDLIGYLVFNGDYTSRTNFYRTEIVNFDLKKRQGKKQEEIEQDLFLSDGSVNKGAFIDFNRVINKARRIIYDPEAPRDFHIPENKFYNLKVVLDEWAQQQLKDTRRQDTDRGFSGPVEKRIAYIRAMTANQSMLHKIYEIVTSDKTKQPLIFYQFEFQRYALRALFELNNVPYAEVNGNSHSFFEDEVTTDMPVLVQYTSGATAFEAKASNTSVYYGLPDSSINYVQSLGRNTRRGQNMNVINNYFLIPYDFGGARPVLFFRKQYERMMTKIKSNKELLAYFTTPWGTFETQNKKNT